MRRSAWLCLAVGLACGCGGGAGGDDASSDARQDAAEDDARSDTGTDGGRDVDPGEDPGAADEGVADTGTDGGRDADPGEDPGAADEGVADTGTDTGRDADPGEDPGAADDGVADEGVADTGTDTPADGAGDLPTADWTDPGDLGLTDDPVQDDTPGVDAGQCSRDDDCPGAADGCLVARCDTQAGTCGFAARTCDDSDPCTTDFCASGTCQATAITGCAAEDCDNKADDNADGRIDCDDWKCAADAGCMALPAGDVCGTAFLVANGDPVGAAAAGTTLTYNADNAGMSDHYASACAGTSWGAPDSAWRLVLAQPMVVTVTHDYAGDDAESGPFALLAVYADICYPDDEIECAWGEDAGAARVSRTFPAGTYHFVADGATLADTGAYTIAFTFALPPTTETLCGDAIDDDGDGLTDCFDTDCEGVTGCEECPVTDHLQCGDTVQGTIVSADQEVYYTFRLADDANVSVTITSNPGTSYEWFNTNFYEGPVTLGCDNLYGVGGTVWHTTSPNAAGFEADGDTDYVIMLSVTNLNQGTYSMSFQCNTEPESQCDDDKDNDADSWIDCEDPDCFPAYACSGGVSGETCATAFEINGGTAITLADAGAEGLALTWHQTTRGKADDLEASCVAASSSGPDAVFHFELADTMDVGFGVEMGMDDFMQQPSLYLFSGQCAAEGLVDCGDSLFGFASLGATLGPGSYWLVVDSGTVGYDGVADRGDFALDAYFDAPADPEDCDNDVDDETDGLTDCQDPECFADAVCSGGHSGENCLDPFLLGGEALSAGAHIVFDNTTIERDDDLSPSCTPGVAGGPDAFHSFTLAEAASVTASVTMDNGFTPALALYAAACPVGTAVQCAVAEWDTASMTVSLEAGAWTLVVDSGDSLFGTPMAQRYSLTVDVAAR